MIKIVLRLKLVFIYLLLLISGCTFDPEKITEIDREPVIEPDYSGVTIPPNIAPMNFMIREDGKFFSLYIKSSNGYEKKIRSKDGTVQFPSATWKKILKKAGSGTISVEVTAGMNKVEGNRYRAFKLHVAGDPVDPWICYRLLYPGYEAYLQIKIIQRSTESFREKSLVENQLLNSNCVNCHSFCLNDPEKFFVHVRGSVGGTYFAEGKKVVRRNLKTSEMKYGAVYPSWHPGGKLVAFSSNSIVQSFHASQEYNIEVTDLASSLVVYNLEKNEMSKVPDDDSTVYMETFPEWSPDGRYLYYCRAKKTNDTSDFARIKYNLVRKPFDQETFKFGKAEILFNADSIDKSVSFPKVSPDGHYLVFTLHNNGNFSIWHKEADLYLLDIRTGKISHPDINSDQTESYHSWSSNSKWLVFSSKRGDGLTARPYFSYLGPDGNFAKPFVLPQKDPGLYRRLVKTFNKPELVTGKIGLNPRDFERASKKEAVKCLVGGKPDVVDDLNPSMKYIH